MNKIPLQQLDGCINTASGRKINLLDPKPEQISIGDIARGLSYNSHFGGQTPQFFSISQHCLLVCELMELRFKKDPAMMMLALLHDASEAYLGDMLKPLKVMLPNFREIEDRMMGVILERYSLDPTSMVIIKEYDILAQEMEYNAFYKNGEIKYLSPEESRLAFLKSYYRYMNQRHITFTL
tara:strand:+ start:8073 stop:8615 length:543 start_codon:yes stop_codon:yes gene_type:complete